MKPRVAFICVGNSCRSQMAEGFAKASGAVDAWSAGSKPTGSVHPTAITLMKEKGIDLSSCRSKGLQDLPSGKWDAIVTMGCGDACPAIPADKRIDWALPDPIHLPEGEFRNVRDEIERRVRALINELAAPTAK